ncbi:hypothetical protein DF037_00780 [Burkholderia contaminans]|uniref:Uncharacterized protein n=1 Tax=Burkholderia contaminans TaxID=488447 RepID=A0A3N8RN32_9BURK|nr:hypothetical protein DF037_00780 [Burkholderia contaminans]
MHGSFRPSSAGAHAFDTNVWFARAKRAPDAERAILSAQSAAAAALRFPASTRVRQPPRRAAGHTATRARTQQIMLRRAPKTVDSYRAGRSNRDKPHFGDA